MKPPQEKLHAYQALLTQGTALLRQQDAEGAAFSFEAAVELLPRVFDAIHLLGVAYSMGGRHAEAVKTLARAIKLDPRSAAAHLNYGIALKATGQLVQAENHQRRAIALQPDAPNMHYNLANTLRDTGKYVEAIQHYRKVLALQPGHPEALNNLSKALARVDDYAEAANCCLALLEHGAPFPFLPGQLRSLRSQCCDWQNYTRECEQLLLQIDAGQPVATPFTLFATPATPAQQKRCAQLFCQESFPQQAQPVWSGERYAHERIRIGYLSSDLFAHATAFLLAEVLEKHDRTRFEVYAYAYGHTRKDAMRTRLEAAVDHFIDISELDDEAVAQLVRGHEIDIAIDLKGHTEASRSSIFAYRCAPVQVSYLGYPGSIGADCIDYLIADPIIIPDASEADYTEKIVRLPECYQPNDTQRQIAAQTPDKQAHGLPEQGFVFCCFNNNFKITPTEFDIWMRLLHQVDGSVLWLFRDNAQAADNLRREAQSRGVDPQRLVFAPRVPLSEHLARYRHADLFLDTFFCNAHTTASDSLWAGLPLITYCGQTFASRVAASLLHAVGLSELVTHSPTEYEALALALARDPARLQGIRQRLEADKTTQPLFDLPRYTRHLESAYAAMIQRHHSGLPTASINVAAE